MAIKSDDKYDALWVSHSSIKDFQNCPNSYYLSNVYKRPETGNKISVINKYLALGIAVHETLEPLAKRPASSRSDIDVEPVYQSNWQPIKDYGVSNVFKSEGQLHDVYDNGLDMVRNALSWSGLYENTEVINEDLPQVWLSKSEDIILCGKMDWIQRMGNRYRIVDFKTGSNRVSSDSLQLPIYKILASNYLGGEIEKAGYFYLRKDDEPKWHDLEGLDEAKSKILNVAREIKQARENDDYKCPRGSCFYCEDLQKVANGKGKYVGTGSFGKDMFVV